MPETINELKDVIIKIKALKAKRAEIEGIVKQLKEAEEKEISKVLATMAVSGSKSLSFEGVGRVTMSQRERAEVRDYNKLQKFVIDVVNNKVSNLHQMDAFALFGKSVIKSQVDELTEMGFDPETFGVKIVAKPTLSITKK